MIRTSLCYSLFLLFFLITCSTEESSLADCSNITQQTADQCIRMNQIQVLGTHNSYKLAPLNELVELFNTERPGWADNILYKHRPLNRQLEELGMRQFELDIFADPEGGLYAEPEGAVLAGDTSFVNRSEMLQPGFKVLHSQDVDYRTTCLTFKACLTEIRDWSLDHPDHLPVLILVEVKDRPLDNTGPFSFTTPIPFDASLMSEIDEEIHSVFSPEQIITPDEVRKHFDTLEEAILTDGWPALSQSRGRVFFALDNTGSQRDAYLTGSPNLEGRVLFVSSEPGEPTAAFIKMNDAINSLDMIKERAEAGYIIRTRADLPLREARTGNTRRLEAALESGAQYISTDFPEHSTFGSDYQAVLPAATGPGRCNPVQAPESCQNGFLEE